MIESPCINICEIDPATRLCQGCYRSLEEIATWPDASDADRRLILAAVKQRRYKLDHLAEIVRNDGN